MAVIAMTREMGSRGREVAQRVADDLGLTVVLHEMVEHDLAERLHVPESLVHHQFEGGASLRERWQVGGKRLAEYTAEEILELAQRGDLLIRGWGACVLLHDIPHVVRVRVCAPMALRERNLMERRGIANASDARREIERNDAAHKRTLHAAFGVDREDPRLYDLVLNTEHLSVETCAKLICDVAASQEFRETDASRALLGDKALEAHLRTKLGARFIAGTGVGSLQATARNGMVVLKGLAIHTSLAAEAGKIAGAIPGVKSVENRIEILHGPRAF